MLPSTVVLDRHSRIENGELKMPKGTNQSDKIGINWPISDDELSKMIEEQLAQTWMDAKADYEINANSILDLIQKIDSPYKTALKGDFFRFMWATQWQMVIGERYVRRNEQHPRPNDSD
jgi:hypothetical protein